MNQDIIDAFPRKKLFIDILTQDVSVSACILDLIDNSVDSYVRTKIEEKREVRLVVKNNYFEIYDTCGGIDKDFLKDNVFKFGSENRNINDPTLGMYGIGLKRSVFKLGENILLETDNGVHFSKMSLNVPEWEISNDWTIPFEFEETKLTDGAKPYTKIVVTNLHTEINNKFNLDSFQNELLETIKRVYCLIIQKNIAFNFNTNDVTPYDLLIPVNDEYAPSVKNEKYNEVQIEIICFINPNNGVKQSNAINERGWNIFCNKRLILANDTSEITGWIGGGDKSVLPRYHNTYNEFRGLVFLESNNPFELPLNTSKSGLNKEHKTYQYVLNLMMKTARPVIDYLADKYNTEKLEEEVVDKQISGSDNAPTQFLRITEINYDSIFKAPNRELIELKARSARISYSREKELVVKVMKYLSATTYKEVGEKTFNYYIEMEGLGDE